MFLAGPRIFVGITCTDQMFSGHTLFATLVTCFWWRMCNSRVVRLFPPLIEIAVLVTMLLSRHHYTADIVIAIIIGVSIFHVYHLLVEIVSIGELVKRRRKTHEQDTKSGDVKMEKIFSKYPAKTIRGLVRFIDGIDIRPTSELRKH